MFSVLFDYAQNSCSLKVDDKLFDVFLITQVIASGEKVLHLKLIIKKTKAPQVLAQACLSRQLPIIGEVIIPLRWSHFVEGSFFVSNVIPHVKDIILSRLCLLPRSTYLPAKFSHRSSDIWLKCNYLAYNLLARLWWLFRLRWREHNLLGSGDLHRFIQR